jgi:hypothetical protein
MALAAASKKQAEAPVKVYEHKASGLRLTKAQMLKLARAKKRRDLKKAPTPMDTLKQSVGARQAKKMLKASRREMREKKA